MRTTTTTGGRVNVEAFSFPRYTKESIYQVKYGESHNKFIIGVLWDSNPRPQNPWSVDDAIC